MANLPPDVAIAVREYFMNQPQEMKAWESIDLARKKKKPDFAVIRYIRQVLALHDRLKNHAWPVSATLLFHVVLQPCLFFLLDGYGYPQI